MVLFSLQGDPVFVPENFGFRIADLLYRFALSFFIKLVEFIKSEIRIPKSAIKIVSLKV